MVDIFGAIIQKQIVEETVDIVGHEQVSVYVRNAKELDKANFFVCKEDFLCFVKADNTTGRGWLTP